MKVTAGTITRTILLLLVWLNVILTFKGMSPIQVDDTKVAEFVSLGFAGIMNVITYWKNNSWTPAAIKADLYKNELKTK